MTAPVDWTYSPGDPASLVSQTRLLINDVSETNPVFNDTEILAFLALNADAVRLAAAQALDTIAGNEVLCSKVIKDHDVTVDGAKVAAELRAQAANLRAQHAETLEADGYFEIVDFGTDLCDRADRWL